MVGITNSSSLPKFAEEATFCKHIRNWTKAEDLPGLSAHERISYAIDLRDWLLTDNNFGEFPLPGK